MIHTAPNADFFLKVASFHVKCFSPHKHLKGSWAHSKTPKANAFPHRNSSSQQELNYFFISAKPFSWNPSGRTTGEQCFLATIWEHSHFSFCEHLIYPKWGRMQLPQGWRKRWNQGKWVKYPCIWWHQPTFERKPSCQACTSTLLNKGNDTHTLKDTWHFTLNCKGHTLKLKELGSFLFVDSSANRLNIRKV